MAMQQSFNTGGFQNTQQSMIAIPQMLIMNFTEKMIEYDLAGEYEKYYKTFKHLYGLLSSYVPTEDRKGIQDDWDSLYLAIDRIEKSTAISDKTKDMEYNKLYRSFVEAHRYYVMRAYSKALYIVNDDARLPIDKMEFDKLANIIRSGFGNVSPDDVKSPADINKPEVAAEVQDADATTE
jgi:hypothetical protein